MKTLILAFLIWAGLGGGLYALLDHFDGPRWWLVVYGFGTMAIILILAVVISNKNKASR